MGWGLPGILHFLPSPTLVPHNEIGNTLNLVPAEATICDVGAGGRRLTPATITVDAIRAPNVDLIGDIHNLPLNDASVDCVFCTGTLEHVRDPAQAVRELNRILKPGGMVHIDVPFIQGYHPDPTDYWRFTLTGLQLLCSGFDELSSGAYIGPSCGLVWIAANGPTVGRIIESSRTFCYFRLPSPRRRSNTSII